MKTITCLALGVILLSFIVENSDGKITILHEGRVSGAPKRKSRRKTVRRRPSTPANEDSGNSTQDKRPLVVCNHTINVYLFLFQRLLSPWSRLFVISKRRPHDKKKKKICEFVFLSQKYHRWRESPHWIWNKVHLTHKADKILLETIVYFWFTLGAKVKDI